MQLKWYKFFCFHFEWRILSISLGFVLFFYGLRFQFIKCNHLFFKWVLWIAIVIISKAGRFHVTYLILTVIASVLFELNKDEKSLFFCLFTFWLSIICWLDDFLCCVRKKKKPRMLSSHLYSSIYLNSYYDIQSYSLFIVSTVLWNFFRCCHKFQFDLRMGLGIHYWDWYSR